MKYYLKKCWPTVTAASICMVVAYGLQVCTSLVQIQITQGLLDGDLRAFTIRIILLLLTWLAVVLCLIAETFFQGRAVRRMNNALRRDMAAGLLHKTHQEYHKQESGEYLSQFTNDVNQIEQMAWTPFFTIMGSAAQVVFGIVALASIHWLLLVISLVIALVMIFVPRLFSKRLGTVGTACAASQADSVSKIKDLLISTTKRYMRGNVNMEIIFDVSYLEIYADGGLETASVCVYPDAPYQVVSTDGDLEVKMYTIKK